MGEVQDTTPRVGPMLEDVSVLPHVRAKYRPMRGQAYIRMEPETSPVLHLLPTKPDDQKSHRGTVLDLGEPARIGEYEGAPECPWDIHVGDVVVFNLFAWLDKMRTLEFFGVEGDVMVVAQGEIVGVET